MALYMVVSLGPSAPAIDSAIVLRFGGDFYRLEPGKWLVSTGFQTSKEVSNALGITADPPATSNLTGVVTAIKGYYGRGPSDLWEWFSKQQL